mmetsp:Transcript_128724/g.321176  ORF Transcript_128724/g.321176 Transcript_128724/m.321176 type:complete len:233 (-) Transcript_128724:611-1309(-)
MLPEMKYSRIASRTSARNCRASPEPQTLRECRGVCRCALRTASTPSRPPKRIRRALLRNSAGKISCSTALRSTHVTCSSRSLESDPCNMPSSLEKPNWRSTSHSKPPPSALFKCDNNKSALRCRSVDCSIVSMPRLPQQAARTTSWWKAALSTWRSQDAMASNDWFWKRSASSRLWSSATKATSSARWASSAARAAEPCGKPSRSLQSKPCGNRTKRPLSRRPTLSESSAAI